MNQLLSFNIGSDECKLAVAEWVIKHQKNQITNLVNMFKETMEMCLSVINNKFIIYMNPRYIYQERKAMIPMTKNVFDTQLKQYLHSEYSLHKNGWKQTHWDVRIPIPDNKIPEILSPEAASVMVGPYKHVFTAKARFKFITDKDGQTFFMFVAHICGRNTRTGIVYGTPKEKAARRRRKHLYGKHQSKYFQKQISAYCDEDMPYIFPIYLEKIIFDYYVTDDMIKY
eukprot:290104_1